MTKAAIVTESSRMLGGPIARRLADDGFAVVLNSAGGSHCAEETVAEIAKAGGKAMAIYADLTVADEVERLFESTLRAFGGIDVVLSDAGILVLSSISRGNVGLFDETIRINLRATYLVLSQAATHINDGGRIVAFSSNAIKRNLPSFGPYNASKAGVEELVRVLANELRSRQVAVNAIAPEHEDEELYLESKSEEEIAELRKLAPPVSRSELNDIVHLVSFLVGPCGGWVSGQVIPVKGSLDLIGSSPDRFRDRFSYSTVG